MTEPDRSRSRKVRKAQTQADRIASEMRKSFTKAERVLSELEAQDALMAQRKQPRTPVVR